MKRLRRLLISLMITALMAAGMPMTAFAKPDWPSDTGIESEAGIVMDADSGAVLFGQNIHVQKAPASITKILTALVVIENSSLDDTITFSHDAVYNVEDGSGNKNSIEEGDTLSVRDCLYLLLMRSSNQAANALAEHVGGSRDGFVKMMNEKTAELGCENSHFANPSGLNDDTQLTSVYDMALIASAAYKNDTLLTISKDKSYRLPATKNNPDGVTIQPEHKLLITTDTESPNYYPYAVAGKTGYTSIAGQTLVTYAIKDDRRQIAVTMKSTQATHYQDTIALMDFGFLRFKNVNISENETAYTSGDQPVQIGDNSYQPSDLSMDTLAVITLPKDASFADAEKTVVTDLPEDAPQGAVALLSYKYNDRKIGQVYLISASAAEAEANGETASDDGNTASDSAASNTGASGKSKQAKSSFHLTLPKLPKVSVRTVLIVVVSVLLAAACAALVWLFYRRHQEEKKRQEDRRKRRRQRLQEIGCSQEEFEKLLEKRMGASYWVSGTAEADESTEQAESDMDVRSGSGQVPAADAAASRLAESGKARTGSTEKKPLKEKLAQKEAEDAKTQQGVQEDDTELTVEDLD
ncbi:MAG: D-alanyl-D-alanine carboxypeptidase [Lachnoclostridium sp.]|uniref:D-alanyl-D-alanine carboxypeptidase family protein n=1 Tax=Clostridium fessum TaxID=2126740 RepID=UPI002A7F3E4A|nr:D-alanyl-D-alanine carboxypeptidase family protein [Clostridium fessum]MCI5803297.1 D-alanyl-D-alanine carboxypeptidase [Lachnoclostridium sp.]MDY4928617.1 D-alanyl-D-alanine carboxypeptidase family protein [Clostridium fessum]